MNILFPRFLGVAFSVAWCVQLNSTPVSSASTPDSQSSANSEESELIAALQWRENLAKLVASQNLSSAEAIAQLRARNSASGLSLEPAADFAFAAIDVGQRLIAATKAREAEPFFLAAEQSLAAVVLATTDRQAREKSIYLRKLALIRGRYLKKPDQAKRDIEQAIVLQPEDKELQRAKDFLARSTAQVFSSAPKN